MRQAVTFKCCQCGHKLTAGSITFKVQGHSGAWHRRFCNFWCFSEWWQCGG